jgi:hypothetical protein
VIHVMSLSAALGFVFFGVIVGLVLVYWYVIRALGRPGQLHAFINSAVHRLPKDSGSFHVLFPQHVCPCCEQTVSDTGWCGSASAPNSKATDT